MTADLDAANAFFVEAFAPHNRADPYDLYRRMRDAGPLISAEIEMHLAFGHADSWSILRNPAASSDERHSAVLAREATNDPRLAALLETRPLLVFMDPPNHTRLRGLVSKGLTPGRIEALRSTIQQLADDLVETILDDGHGQVDIVEQLAYPLPIAVICHLLGIPASDHHMFGQWSAALTKSVDPAVLRSEADNHAIAVATAELHTYTTALLEDRRSGDTPGDDLLAALVHQHEQTDGLDDGELADLVTLLLFAGHETTVNLIGNGLDALLQHPNQQNDWSHHPDIADHAIDELLRYDSPLQMVQRVATRDLTLRDRSIRTGDQIIVMLGAANRDPSVFPDPDALDIRRPTANRHLAFGGGIHHCLGAALARVEGAIAITTLLRTFPHLEPAGPAPIRDTFNLRGRAQLPVDLGTPTIHHTRTPP